MGEPDAGGLTPFFLHHRRASGPGGVVSLVSTYDTRAPPSRPGMNYGFRASGPPRECPWSPVVKRCGEPPGRWCCCWNVLMHAVTGGWVAGETAPQGTARRRSGGVSPSAGNVTRPPLIKATCISHVQSFCVSLRGAIIKVRDEWAAVVVGCVSGPACSPPPGAPRPAPPHLGANTVLDVFLYLSVFASTGWKCCDS